MRKERECGGKEEKSRRKSERRSAGVVMEQLGSPFALHCGLTLPVTLSSLSACVCMCHCFLQVSDIVSCYLTHCRLPARPTTDSTLQTCTHAHTHTHTHTHTRLWIGDGFIPGGMKNDFASWGWVYIWLSPLYSGEWWWWCVCVCVCVCVSVNGKWTVSELKVTFTSFSLILVNCYWLSRTAELLSQLIKRSLNYSYRNMAEGEKAWPFLINSINLRVELNIHEHLPQN